MRKRKYQRLSASLLARFETRDRSLSAVLFRRWRRLFLVVLQRYLFQCADWFGLVDWRIFSLFAAGVLYFRRIQT